MVEDLRINVCLDNAGSNRMSTTGAGKSAVKLENETEELKREVTPLVVWLGGLRV